MNQLLFSGFAGSVGVLLLTLVGCGVGAAEPETITLQYACINRVFKPCQLVQSTFVPMVDEATDGRVQIQVTSFPELGLAGPSTLRLVRDGSLGFTEVYAGYVAGDVPLLDIQFLWGTVRDRDAKERAVLAAREEMDRIVSEATGGGVILVRNWYPSDNWLFSRQPLRTVEDFKGKKIRLHSTALGDFIKAFNAEGQFVAAADVYTALERGILDGAFTCTACGMGLKLYEVTGYLVGPIPDRSHTWAVVNKNEWEKIPEDLQQTLLEVSREYEEINKGMRDQWEAEALATAQAQGMEIIEFSPEMRQAAWDVALSEIIPGWVKRSGGADSADGQRAISLWNDYFGPHLGVQIHADGSATEIPVAR